MFLMNNLSSRQVITKAAHNKQKNAIRLELEMSSAGKHVTCAKRVKTCH